jgi:two-component system, NtrC family, response regulator AtoC
MKLRVLIIDDEIELAKLTARVLQEAGYECETCASATDALQTFEQREADVVITDLKMPRMDGLELMTSCASAAPGCRSFCLPDSQAFHPP